MKELYTKIEKIGEGTCGTVYKAKNNSTNQIVAIKKFKELGSNEGIPQNCLREIQILRSLEHRKDIANAKNVYMHQSGQVHIIFQYYKCNLKKVITSGEQIDWKQFIKQMIQAVVGIHQVNIIHRDLKPQNILMGSENQPLLADFGFAKELEFGQKMTNMVGTQAYRAPELILGDVKYGKQIDIWSLGCIIYQIFSNKISSLYKMFNLLPNSKIPSYFKKLPKFQSLIKKVQSHQPQNSVDPLSCIPQYLHDVFIKMLELDPCQRISAKQALEILK